MPRSTAWAIRERTVKPILRVSSLLPAIMAVVLAACSGGVDTATIPNAQTASAATYNGPAPTTADVQAFKVNLWQYIDTANRCGNCHKAGGQTPMFARSDDVNLAYGEALKVVNLAQARPVADGHQGGRRPQLLALEPRRPARTSSRPGSRNWAGGVASGGTQIKLQAPALKDVGSTKTFPASASDNGSAAFAQTVYPLLSQFCSRCHSAGAATPQTPILRQQRRRRGLRQRAGQTEPRHAGVVALLCAAARRESQLLDYPGRHRRQLPEERRHHARGDPGLRCRHRSHAGGPDAGAVEGVDAV